MPLYKSSYALPFVKNNIFGVQITNESASDILKYVIDFCQKKTGKLMIFTPNPEIIVYATKHSEFRKVLNVADISLADGFGVVIASKLLGRPIKERITGVDFMLSLCEQVSKKPITIGLLGAQPGIANITAECLEKTYPDLKIAFVGDEWDMGKSDENKKTSSLRIPSSEIDILFVAFGFPKQEEWIYSNLHHIPVRVAIGVGGAFDYISGVAHRAPVIIRLLGFEWLYRLIYQPWRWRRQLALIDFIQLVLQEMFFKKR